MLRRSHMFTESQKSDFAGFLKGLNSLLCKDLSDMWFVGGIQFTLQNHFISLPRQPYNYAKLSC